jgi:hypothetical protein
VNPRYSDIPQELTALPNWVVWRLEKRVNKSGIVKETKTPYNAHTGRLAQSNNPATWSDFGDATQALKKGYSGLGFCFSPPYAGADLDGCRQSGGADEPWAAEIIRELDSYTELSPSGHGVHVIVKGSPPLGPRQKDFKDREHHGVGLYDAARGRYLTFTGCRISGGAVIRERTAELHRIHARLFPPQPPKAKANTKAGATLPDDDLIARALKAKDGSKFSRLWNGQWEGEYASQSEADLALATKLAFWTGRDPNRIDVLFRRSALMREKWNRKDYREPTIAKAIDQTSETWGSRPHPASAAAAVIDLSRLQPCLELLNSLTVWQGRIQFTSVRRRGPMLIATTSSGVDVVWPSTAELGSFSKTQAIVSDSTNIWIPTPGHRQIRAQWEPAIGLLLELAARDGLRLEPALKEEIRDLVRLMWRAAGQPAAKDSGEFMEFMRAVQHTRRNPAGAFPPCVFAAEEQAWIHVPSFRAWLSLPSLTNRLYPLTEVRNGLLLLGFVYCENLRRGHEGDTETTCLWRGPLDVLGLPPKEPEK